MPPRRLSPTVPRRKMPKNVVISEDGASISGTAEPGSAITIATLDGKPLGSGKADGEGHFTPSPRPFARPHEQVTVTATDSANNVSLPTTAQAPDITAPDKPIITRCWTMLKASPPLTDKPPTTTVPPLAVRRRPARVEVFDNGVFH